MEPPESDKSFEELISVLRGERVRNPVKLPETHAGAPRRSAGGNSARYRQGTEGFAANESPGQSPGFSRGELGITTLAWVVMGGVVVALIYFCYTFFRFAAAL